MLLLRGRYDLPPFHPTTPASYEMSREVSTKRRRGLKPHGMRARRLVMKKGRAPHWWGHARGRQCSTSSPMRYIAAQA